MITPTILLIDDEREIVDLVSSVLRQSGYKVLDAHCPDDAISLCADAGQPVHLVISDFQMPGQNGRELARSLRIIRPGLEFLFMTANPTAFDELTAEGFVCLFKPFSLGELRERVQEGLHRCF